MISPITHSIPGRPVILFTMGLAGLWHGAGVMFIAWGFYHGLLILIYRLPPLTKFIGKSDLGGMPAALAMATFCTLNVFGWMMFRAGSGKPGEFELMLNSLSALPDALGSNAFLLAARQLALLAIPLLTAEWIAYKLKAEFPDFINRLAPIPLCIVLVLMWFSGMMFAKRSGYDFIYFAF